MKKNFSQYLDLPHLEVKWEKGDQKMLQHLSVAKPEELTKQYDGSYLGDITYRRFAASQPYVDWVNTTIPELQGIPTMMGWQYHTNSTNNPNGAQMIVHSDGIRGIHIISYCFSSGGTDVTTSWYQEHGFPVHRTPLSWCKDYSRLDELESIVFEENKWAIFRSDVLHNVKIIREPRECFTVGFNNEDVYQAIKAKYGV